MGTDDITGLSKVRHSLKMLRNLSPKVEFAKPLLCLGRLLVDVLFGNAIVVF